MLEEKEKREIEKELKLDEEKQKKEKEEEERLLQEKLEEEKKIIAENERLKKWEKDFDEEQKKKEKELIEKFYRNTDKKSDADEEIDNQKNYTENNDTKTPNDNDQK